MFLLHMLTELSQSAVAAAVAPRFPGGVGVTLSTQIPIKIEIKIQILRSEKISTFSPEGQLYLSTSTLASV